MADKVAMTGIHHTGYFVRWHAYGEWKQTSMIWADKREADRHADYLTREGRSEYNKRVKVIETSLPLSDN